MKSRRTHALHANMSSLVRTDTVDGVEYVVCPAILINEGVHNGVFYPAEELSRHTDAWNGRPVVLGHPTANGKPVTANSKKVKESTEIGMLLNAFWDADLKALKADVYINRAKCKTRAPRVLEKLEADEGMDVSTGLFTDDEFKANSFNQKEYDCVARNHRPDHLAVLPDGRGACSWEDGAGLPRINEEDEGGDDELTDVCDTCGTRLEKGLCPRCTAEQKQNSSIFSRFCQFIGLSHADAARTEPKLNEASFNERIQKLSSAITAKYQPAAREWGVYAQPVGPMPWVQDVYETWCVYQLGDKRFRVDYEWDSDLEKVEITSEPEEVVQKQVYSKVTSPKANGGQGSGNFGHAGRPGHQGGSGEGGGADGEDTTLYHKGEAMPLKKGESATFTDSDGKTYTGKIVDYVDSNRVRVELPDGDKSNVLVDALKKGGATDETGEGLAAQIISKLEGKYEGAQLIEKLEEQADLADRLYSKQIATGRYSSEDLKYTRKAGLALYRKVDELKKAKEASRSKQNEFLDPRGSEQPPVWAQQEGSPSMDKPMKVNSLIQSGALDPNLRETMLAAPDAVVMAFDQLATKAQRPKTLEEMAKELSPEEKKKLDDMAAAKKAKDEAEGKEGKDLITKIKGNAANKFSDEDLGAMTVPQLRTLSAMLPPSKTDHAAAAGGAAAAPKTNESDDVPEMPSLDEAIKANQSK